MEIDEEQLPLEALPRYCYSPGETYVADPDGSIRCLTEKEPAVTIPMFLVYAGERRAIEDKFRRLKIKHLRVVIGFQEDTRLTGFIGSV